MAITHSTARSRAVRLPARPLAGATGLVRLLPGLAVAAAVFVLAVVPRLIGLGQYVTADEDLTLGRSASFAQAIAEREWRRTYQVGHPEVTVS